MVFWDNSMIHNSPKVIVITAPSGAGKTTIKNEIFKVFPNLGFSVSATNREKRDGEIEGADYFFLTTEAFRVKVDAGEFLEWEEVYPGRFYGTLNNEIQRLFNDGKIPVFDIDVKGAMTIKKKFNDNALVVFIHVPIDILKQRLISRGTETEDSLAKRIDRYTEEMKYMDKCDVVIENIDLRKAINDTKVVIDDFLKLA